MKIAIIGMGRVGSCLAFSLGMQQIVDEIVAIGRNQDYLNAQVEDLKDGFIISNSKTKIVAGSYEQIVDAEIVCITADSKVDSNGDRLNLFNANKQLIESIIDNCNQVGYRGIYLIATNPVDVMTMIASKAADSKRNKVIGSGVILDNARFKSELSNVLKIEVSRIKSNCVGEHGRSICLLFDSVMIDNTKLVDYLKLNNITINKDLIYETVVTKGPAIYSKKGATEFGIASSLTEVIKVIANNNSKDLLVTSFDAEGNVFISNLYNVTKEGVSTKQSLSLSETEEARYSQSCSLLKAYDE